MPNKDNEMLCIYGKVGWRKYVRLENNYILKHTEDIKRQDNKTPKRLPTILATTLATLTGFDMALELVTLNPFLIKYKAASRIPSSNWNQIITCIIL